MLTVLPALAAWRRPSLVELALLALVGSLGAIGQFLQFRAFSIGELSAVAPIDYRRLIFAGVIGYIMFAEIPDRYTLAGTAIIVGSTLYIACREIQLSRLTRAGRAGVAPEPAGIGVPIARPGGAGKTAFRAAAVGGLARVISRRSPGRV